MSAQTLRRTRRVGVALAAACLMGIHSSARAEAGLLAPPKGEYSIKTSFYASSTRHTFNSRGHKVVFMFNGRSTVLGANLEILYGVTDRLAIYVNIPYVGYDLSDDIVRGTGSGPGDAVLSGRLRMLTSPVETHLELGLKFPTADARDPSRVLVGEGQYDVDMSLLLAAPLGGRSRWITGQLGYRYRSADTERNWKPGDEFMYRIESGYNSPGPVGVSLALNGFAGGREESFDLPLDDTQRELVSLVPAISYGLGKAWTIRVDYSLPLDGRNYFAGAILGAAIIFSSSGSDTDTAKSYVPSVRGVSCCRPR